MNIKMLKAALTGIMFTISSFAHAGIIELTWNTSLSSTSIVGTNVGDNVSLVFRFDSLTNDLSNLVLNKSSFLDYSFNLDDGRFITFDSGISTTYVNNDFFVFNSLGNLYSVNGFHIRDSDVESNIVGVNGTFQTLFNNGANCILCFGTNNAHVNNVGLGLSADSWTIRYAQVPEPSTLAIFALGMIGIASRRFKKQS
jgi:hypothetical protein